MRHAETPSYVPEVKKPAHVVWCLSFILYIQMKVYMVLNAVRVMITLKAPTAVI